ncbi:hypothetical protein [Cellulomonas edaphi]|uniref:Secreted protein n=1 Tax=Cellulomonas edaphi TaxID=3053468 RepID=A0ABT7S2M2_9CELL|nr:hypothetical protein [Cellulomons edaphi]MDM7829860.1 hypothetical protein [Cellulomons edaphi]
MTTLMTVLTALVILSPLVVLALRSTRWDPVERRRAGSPVPVAPRRVVGSPSLHGSATRAEVGTEVGGAADDVDADARRVALDVAAVAAHEVSASR